MDKVHVVEDLTQIMSDKLIKSINDGILTYEECNLILNSLFKMIRSMNSLTQKITSLKRTIPTIDANTIKKIHEITESLSIERACDDEKWIEVGKCLKGIHSIFYNEFNSFSLKCPEKYEARNCSNTWSSINITVTDNRKREELINMLCQFADEDNSTEYQRLGSVLEV